MPLDCHRPTDRDWVWDWDCIQFHARRTRMATANILLKILWQLNANKLEWFSLRRLPGGLLGLICIANCVLFTEFVKRKLTNLK